MKSIELTKEHKSKLLEMCKVLFPEYNIFINLNNYEGDFVEQIFIYIGSELKIHWFEFCMTHLMYKLSYEFFKVQDSKDKPIHLELWSLNKGSHFTKHPVDYLYEEFKKLK